MEKLRIGYLLQKTVFAFEYFFDEYLVCKYYFLGVSYIMTSKDEALLNDNYWENNNLE